MKKGALFALLASFVSGISIFYNKIAVSGNTDILVFNILKNGGAAIFLTFLLLRIPYKKKILQLDREKWFGLLLVGVIGGSIPFLMFFEGLKSVSSVNAGVIQKTLFLWVSILAIPVLREKLSLLQIAGYLLVVWSNILSGGIGFNGSTGELLILGATILWSVEIIISKKLLREMPSEAVAWGRMFLGTLVLLTVAAYQDKIRLLFILSGQQWLQIAGSILLLTLYVSLVYKALKHAPAGIVTSILVLSTPVTGILTSLFLTHTFTLPQIQNIVVTIAGTVLITKLLEMNKKTTAHQPIHG